jgi:hypothetical protein
MPTKAVATTAILAVVATVSAHVRRVALIGLGSLVLCAPALAAGLPAHSGQPVLPGSRQVARVTAYPRTLVELSRAPSGGDGFALRASGGEPIDPQLSLWRLPSAAAARLLPALRAHGLVRSVTPDLPLQDARGAGALDLCPDPLCPQEWWWTTVGADRWTAPGPGVPVTMIDTGADLSHPEFAARPDTTALDAQTFSTAFPDELHGTATASAVAAPANGAGVVGIYPQAKLQVWDSSPAGVLTVGDEIAGLAAATAHGRGVINLSIGGTDRLPVEEHAILAAFGNGSLVVASAGNARTEGNPLAYPASFAHVLTIGATDQTGRPAWFSSASSHMDLAAPGTDIPVAIPQTFAPSGSPYDIFDGTSFSAPLVSGVAAAVWTVHPTLTNTQLFEVLRHSAHRAGKPGWNRDTGYGILDAPAALTRRPPAADPQEPNEDVYLVRPKGLFRAGHEPLTAPGRRVRVLAAHVEQGEDPEDVYRAYLPAKGRLVVSVKTNANVDLEVWGRRTRTVFERGTAAKRDLLGLSRHAGARAERVVVRGRGSGQYVYVDVFLAKKPPEAGYTLRLGTARR